MATIIVAIIALIAAILVGKDANKRGMNMWGWSLFVFFLLIIGLPAYFIARKPLKYIPKKSISHENTKNKKLNEHSSTIEEKKKTDEYSLILEKKEILSDLKRDNVITVNEYNEKLTLLNEQKKNIIKQKKKKQIDTIVETQIAPYISKLDELLKASILSKDEFETKKKQLYKKHYEKIVNEMPNLSPNKSQQIETISRFSFKPAQQRRLTDIERNLQKGDVILTDKKSKNIFYIYHQDEFKDILNDDVRFWDKYIHINLY